MEENLESTDVKKTVIVCEPTLDINFAAALYEHLKMALDKKHAVEINVGQVTKVDTSILQVFLAFQLEAKNLNLDVSWSEISEPFRVSADLLGMTEVLDLPQAA